MTILEEIQRLNNVEINIKQFTLLGNFLKIKTVGVIANNEVLQFLSGVETFKTTQLTESWSNLCLNAKELKITGDLKMTDINECKFIVGSIEIFPETFKIIEELNK
jgi:hypothetical protein